MQSISSWAAERRLDDRDVLLTVAEIATAFAGFATIAAVFGSKGDQDADPRVLARFRTLLVYSLSAVVLCFVPFIPLWYGYSAESIWYASSWLLAAIITCINIAMTIATREVASATSKLILIPWIFAAWAPVFVAGLSLGGVGTTSGNYLVALLIVLLLAVNAFILVIASVLTASREHVGSAARQADEPDVE